MKFIILGCSFLFTALFVSCASKPTSHTSNNIEVFANEPEWVEHFDINGAPDTSIWSYDIGNHGWGNNELQFYTNTTSNASVANGMLHIIAKKEDKAGSRYTSARMVTRGKKDFLYGRIEVRAKLPSGVGTWPAIWMLPTDWEYGNWPNSGEIDIMEHVGKDAGNVHFSIHTASYNHSIGTQKTSKYTLTTAMSDFHIYRVDWTPTYIKGYFDNIEVFTFENDGKGDAKTWPFDKKFHLLLNIAIGGNWGGPHVDDYIFPAVMMVDYIKYYPLSSEKK